MSVARCPAAGVLYGGGAPDTCGAIEVEPVVAEPAAGLLDHEVSVDRDRLEPCEQRVVAVQVTPARLYERQLFPVEMRNGTAQEVGCGDEVRVEDRDELTGRTRQAMLKRACLEAGSLCTLQMDDVHASGPRSADRSRDERRRLVGGVVEHLYLEQLARIVEAARSFDHALRHVELVVNGQLDGDSRQPPAAPQFGFRLASASPDHEREERDVGAERDQQERRRDVDAASGDEHDVHGALTTEGRSVARPEPSRAAGRRRAFGPRSRGRQRRRP